VDSTSKRYVFFKNHPPEIATRTYSYVLRNKLLFQIIIPMNNNEEYDLDLGCITMTESLRKMVYSGYFICEIKKSFHSQRIRLDERDYEVLQDRLIKSVWSESTTIKEKIDQLMKEIENFICSVKHLRDFEWGDMPAFI
jgi:hemerythrin superfamily protein